MTEACRPARTLSVIASVPSITAHSAIGTKAVQDRLVISHNAPQMIGTITAKPVTTLLSDAR